MQVFVILAIVVVSAAGKGSGPYLPSGWRPTGPAFYLPTEVQKPAENLQDVILGSEASGSDALREYGPPKLEISVNQGLPDVAIEQNFVDAVVSSEEVVGVSTGQIVEEVGKLVGESTENSGLQATTEGQINVVVVYETAAPVAEERSLSSEILAEVNEATVIPTLAVESEVAAIDEATTKQVVDAIVAEFNEAKEQLQSEIEAEINEARKQVESEIVAEINEATVIPTEQVSEVEIKEAIPTIVAESEVAKISESTTDAVDVREKQSRERSNLEVIAPEVLANLENAVRTEIAISQQVDSSSQETSGSSDQVPEGFLEYGPPGFKEYGPPKEDIVAIQGLLSQASVETNETRRRRFSPKFKPVKKLH